MDILNATIKLALGLAVVLFIFRTFKKELAQITPIDLLFILIVGDLFGGIAHTPEIPIWHLVLIPIWAVMIWILEKVKQKTNIQKKLEGAPQTIIKNGEILVDVMEDNRLSEPEIMHQLRERGIFDLDDVELGILETSGNITAKKKD